MSDQIFATGMVRFGQLKVRDRERFEAQVKTLGDGEVVVTVERKRATRSSQANRFYWGVVIKALSDHTGYTPDEMHEIAKAKFIPKRLAICDGNGEVVDEFVIGGTTTKLNVGEFHEYIRDIKMWAVELGLYIPEPDSD